MAADIVFNANAVGDVVTYVAPGFLAYTGYRLRYPGGDRPPGEVLIISVVASLPLVALVMAALPGTQKPSQLGYVAVLLVLALVLGYLSAVARGTDTVKKALGRLGHRMEPEGSIYAQTVYHLPANAPVLVELKDGRRITGCARNGPQHKDDGINELYIVYPEALDDDGNSVSIGGAGIIIRWRRSAISCSRRIRPERRPSRAADTGPPEARTLPAGTTELPALQGQGQPSAGQ